ncbi:T-cell immunoreceptor with Ig and ITIM domains [Hyperolius riggenbachi]|uniref:T-cell immunoreceptor with Ig and ITIM domains n=1 Tax=Hyperolius riggenbachi TaxID=752182 RepID=UPI0035A3C656
MMSPRGLIVPLTLCYLLHLTGVSVSASVETHNITAASGSDVTLKCHLQVEGAKVTQVNWHFCNEEYIAIHVNDHDTRGTVKPKYAERVSLAEDYGIVISNVSAGDAGPYCCEFNIFPHGKFTGKIYLEVLANSATKTSGQYLWFLLAAGILVSAVLGTLCYKRRSRSTPSTVRSNTLPGNPTSALSSPSSPDNQDSDDETQEYFNVIINNRPTAPQRQLDSIYGSP